MRLDGPAIERLRSAIADAFSMEDLEELVFFTFSEELYGTYAPVNSALRHAVFRLLIELNKKELVPIFLRAVVKARSTAETLLEVIEECCPSAMRDPPTPSEAVETASQGIETIGKMRAGTELAGHINDRVAGSRKKLESLRQGLKELRSYKTLHDVLQMVQLEQYKELASNIDRLRDDSEFESALSPVITRLIILSEEALQTLDGLSRNSNKYTREKEWVDEFSDAVHLIGKAIEEENDAGVRNATSTIRQIIRMKPTHLNDELRNTAEELPLASLISTVDAIALIPELPTGRKQELLDTKANLEDLWVGLRGRIAVHDRWQSVETELWGADNVLSMDDLEEFKLHLAKAKQHIKALWNIDPSAVWVTKTQRYAESIEAALNTLPGKAKDARQSYDRFRTLARLQFHSEDVSLRSFCDKILLLSEPLDNLLGG